MIRSPFLWAAGTVTALAVSAFALVATGQAGPPGQAARSQAGRGNVSVGSQGKLPEHAAFTPDDAKRGGNLFLQNCAFCHGKDASGGESGPALTRSKLVMDDKNGENITPVLRNGRLEKGMPRFDFNEADLHSLVAFIHTQQDGYLSQTGTRKGVEVEDLQTGNVAAGRQYFEGAGGCSKCHSVDKDLKGFANRFQGLQMEQRMLYPRDAKAGVTVTTAQGKKMIGELSYLDEFTLSFRDSSGDYHSFPVKTVKFAVNNPVQAHVDQFSKYTDDDIHNLMAYMQTLK